MSAHLRLAAAVLYQYSQESGDSPHDLVTLLHVPGDVWEQMALVEGLAIATWRVMQKQGIPLPTLLVPNAPYLFSRPFDDGTAQLIIIDSHHTVIYNDRWPTCGRFSTWTTAINALATAIRTYSAQSHTALATDASV